MAQPKRNQPLRACRDPPPVYREEEPETEEYAEADRNKAAVEKKRQRNQYRWRAPSPEPPTLPEADVRKPPKMKKSLWRKLTLDLVENVLSHLPVHTLWHTVMAINPTRWKQILANNGNAAHILGHGNHVDSSIGYMRTYSTTWWSLNLPMEDDLRPPAPRALDHSTQKWQTLPRFPEVNIRLPLTVQSVSEGLILLVMPEYGDSDVHSMGYRYRHRMATWNPASVSSRWLPRSPVPYNNPDFVLCMEVLVVDPAKRSYKVVEFVASVTGLAMHPMRRHGPYRPQQKAISRYAVYDSVAATWGGLHRPPQNIAELRLNHRKSSVSCDGCVCFVTVVQQLVSWELPRGIVCYNPTTDAWSEALFPAKFFDKLPGIHTGCHVKELLYAAGQVYVIFTRMSRAALHSYYIASVALVDIQSGVAAFAHVGRVREADRSASVPGPDHPTPKCWQSKPTELILQRPCARSCSHRWYMLPVGSVSYLCVVLCGRWHKRFDLDAGVWTDLLMEVPCEKQHGRAVMTTVLPSGNTISWDANYAPYIPSWVKV